MYGIVFELMPPLCVDWLEEEADESHFFIEILIELYDLEDESVKNEMIRLCKEANELVAIIVASINTAKNKLK